MVTILVVVNGILLLLAAALWEWYRVERRRLPDPTPDRVAVRLRARPAIGLPHGRARTDLSGLGLGDLGGPSAVVAPPVWGDNCVLIETEAGQVDEVVDEVVDRARAAGFSPLRRREDGIVLRRGLRLLSVDRGRS